MGQAKNRGSYEDRVANAVKNDARVLVDMNYLGIQTAVAANHSLIVEMIEAFKKQGTEFVRNVFEFNKGLLPLADAGFTQLNAEGHNLNDAALVFGTKDGSETMNLTWTEFCDRCVDYAVANLILNDDPLRIIPNGYRFKDRQDVRDCGIRLPTKKDDALIAAMDCVMSGTAH